MQKVTDMGSRFMTFAENTHFYIQKSVHSGHFALRRGARRINETLYQAFRIDFPRFPGKWVFVPRVREIPGITNSADPGKTESAHTRGTKTHIPGNRENPIWIDRGSVSLNLRAPRWSAKCSECMLFECKSVSVCKSLRTWGPCS